MSIPEPIFQDKIKEISWKKIYSREYGVQYSEMAILCLSSKAKHHVPKPSQYQVVIPENNNTSFYIDDITWVKLVESLNKKYTTSVERLERYEKQFILDGENYLKVAKTIASLDLRKLTNNQLSKIYKDYQNKLFLYSLFTWTAFILNNYVSEHAKMILDNYIQKHKRSNEKQLFIDSLFKPVKKATVLRLQEEINRFHGKLSKSSLDNLYTKYKWLSCLDIHNKPWTKKEFHEYIRSFTKTVKKNTLPLSRVKDELKINNSDMSYLFMAQRFVYIKDARDDFRRQGVYYALPFFKELARRMNINSDDVSYLQESEVLAFLNEKLKITKQLIRERRNGFILYLDKNKTLICLTDKSVNKALKLFNLSAPEETKKNLHGSVASRGVASGKVVIVRGIKDLNKVEKGNILVAITTHPDYVSAIRKSAAIVTDEGGITSHAAIVSREFDIPCIVGTKSATSILRDGDLVEVDAIDGFVKKL